MKFDNNNDLIQQEEDINFKKIFFRILGQWYWFVIFGILGLAVAYAYTKLTKPGYLVSNSILVPQKSKGMDMKDLFSGNLGMGQNTTQINNQIEILKSTFTIKKTLERLNWRTSWYMKKNFIWHGIYKNEPFDVQEPLSFINPPDIKIYITPSSDNSYLASASGVLKYKGTTRNIDFEARGEFGKPFRNEYFNFTLLQKVNNIESSGENYYFEFNDLKQNTLTYQEKLKVALKDEESEIIICSIKGEEPTKESDFLNELNDVYIAQKLDLQNQAQRQSLDFIDTQLSSISDSVNAASNKFTDYRAKNSIINLGEEGTIVMTNLKQLESERAQNQIQLDYFKNILLYLEESEDITKIASPSVVGIQDPSLNLLVTKIGELYNRKQILSFSAKPNNPTLILIDKELADARSRLNENLRNLIDNATKSINSLKDRENRINAQLNKLPAKEQQMINIQRKYNITNEVYNFLLQKRAETNIALAASISDVQIIENADPDYAKPVSLARMVILYIGLFLGLLIPALAIILVDLFDNRIRTQEDVENNTQLPIVANIMHSTEPSTLTVFNDPRSNIAESFREMRTNLEFLLSGSQAKVISIQSTNPGEGKSYISTNLGTILAMNDNKVLVIGADMRKPKLHKIFDLENKAGLSTYLIGQDSFEETIFETAIKNLSVITSGPIPPNPAEILSKPAMKELIDRARLQFDYIILDNAPVALVTDGIITGRLSDLNIFILRFGISNIHQLELINHLADTKKVNNIGIIVNDIKANSLGNGYYKYYQYEAYKKTYYADEETGKKRRWKKKDKV